MAEITVALREAERSTGASVKPGTAVLDRVVKRLHARMKGKEVAQMRRNLQRTFHAPTDGAPLVDVSKCGFRPIK